MNQSLALTVRQVGTFYHNLQEVTNSTGRVSPAIIEIFVDKILRI
jgi:hypothetical protein